MSESIETCVRIARRGSGFAAEAPQFYVWDEDAGRLLRSATELADALAARSTERSGDSPRRLERRPPS